ncbi:hypothetical protein AVEN_260519-1 [Araneus ventricosus]|uniref:Uncharacterized protein n=1 Tax=Araneus ventricosus TaxID=182803 RepID=A0A4Y2PLK5_ARAVE|nr:hypothetical protein AVEN_260519-1 [Araneus ventricosus]
MGTFLKNPFVAFRLSFVHDFLYKTPIKTPEKRLWEKIHVVFSKLRKTEVSFNEFSLEKRSPKTPEKRLTEEHGTFSKLIEVFRLKFPLHDFSL